MAAMHCVGLLLLVSAHLLLTGRLATAAGLGLAKSLYASPPRGVDHAAAGAELMYNGGTVVHLAVAGLLWRQWYRSRGAVRAAERAVAASA
jgi:putative membrane protein